MDNPFSLRGNTGREIPVEPEEETNEDNPFSLRSSASTEDNPFSLRGERNLPSFSDMASSVYAPASQQSAAQTTPVTEDTPESRFYTPERLEKIRNYYALQGKTYTDDNELIEEFEWDRTGRNINTIGIGAEVTEAYTGSDEEKAALSDIREIWEERPGIFKMPTADDWSVFNPEGRGLEGVGENLIFGLVDPINLFGFGIAKGAAVGAGQTIGRTAISQGLRVGALNAGLDAAVTGAGEAALQDVDVELGRKEEIDWAQVGLSALTGGVVSFGVNAPVATGLARRNLQQGVSKTADDIARAAQTNPEVATLVDNLTPKDRSVVDRARTAISAVSSGDWWKQKMLDRFRSVAELDETLAPGTDYGYGPLYREMRLTENAGKMAESAVGFHGITAGVPKVVDPTSLSSEFTGTNINLRNVFDTLDSPVDSQTFMTWVAANRMRNLRAAGKEIDARFTDGAIDEIIRIGDANPKFREAAKKYGEYNRALMEFARDTNVISQESFDNIIRAASRDGDDELAGAFYVPFFRLENLSGEVKLRGSGADDFGLKAFRGGELEQGQTIANLLENTVINTASIIEAGVRNRAKLNLISALEANGLTDIAAKAAPNRMTKMTRTIDEVRAALVKNATDPADQAAIEKAINDAAGSFSEDFLEFYSRSTKFRPEDGMEVVLRDGKIEYWEIKDPMLLDSLQSLGPDPAQMVGFLGQVGQFAKGLLTETVTTFPTFAARNYLRDTQNAVVLSKTRGTNRLLPIIDSVRAIKNEIAESPEYQDFILNGGGFSSIRLQEGQLSSRTMADIVRQGNASDALLIGGVNDLRNLASLAWEKYTRGLSSVENANRFAEYRRLVSQGWNKRDAALASRNLSTDFSMRGSSANLRAFMSMVPFLNAGLQGIYVTARNLASPESRANTIVKGLLTTTIPAMGLYVLNQDYEVIADAPDSDKDLNFLIPVDAEGNPYPEPEDAVSYIKIPKSYDVGVLAGSTLERILDNRDVRNIVNSATGEESLSIENSDTLGETLAHMYRLVTDIMLLDPTPQIAVPAMALMQNETWTGAPIVGPDLEGLPSSKQFDETTPYWARSVGEVTGLSPKQIEFAAEAYTGTWGAFLSDMVDRAVRSYDEGDNKPDLPALELGQLPIVSAFITSSRTPKQFEIDFFRFLNNAGKDARWFDKLKSEGRVPELEELLKEDDAFAKKVQASKALQGAYRKLSQINKRIDMIMRDTKTDGEEKQALIEELRPVRQEVIKGFMDVVRKDDDLRSYVRGPGGEGVVRRIGDSLAEQTEEVFSE